LKEFARGRIANLCMIVEVRIKHHPYTYFLLSKEDVDEWVAKVSEKAVWADIPLWYIYEKGIGFNMQTAPVFNWTPLETNQVQIGDDTDG